MNPNKSQPTEIKSVTLGELKTLCHISRQTFAEAFEAANEPEPFQAYLDQAFSTEKLKKELTDRSSVFFFAMANQTAVGYLKLVEDKYPQGMGGGKVIEIQRIYVRKAYLGMGVGKMLMEKSLEVAKAKNAAYIWLGVWEFNPKAIAFYEKWGFKSFGNQAFKMGAEIQNDLLMKKELFPPS